MTGSHVHDVVINLTSVFGVSKYFGCGMPFATMSIPLGVGGAGNPVDL